MSWEALPLRGLPLEVRSGFACGVDDPEGVWQFRMNNVTIEGQIDISKQRRVPRATRNLDSFLLVPGDVLFNATNSPELVGKTAYFEGSAEPAVFSNHFLRLRATGGVLDGRFLARWLQGEFTRGRFLGLCKQWVNQATVSRDALLDLEIPLPPLPEQRRIADILDRAEALRTKRRAALERLEELTQAMFLEMFGDPVRNPKGWETMPLGEVAEIQGGLQQAPRRQEMPRQVPYLRVANVYRGFLDLTQVKLMGVTSEEQARTALMKGDLLFVEGHGNPDEVGRCAVWDGSIKVCTHQNHLIRARVRLDRLLPAFACQVLNSESGRRHFRQAGRTTSGLNTINVSQVRAAAVPLPPLSLQRKFTRRAEAVERLRAKQRAALAELDGLFTSLQHRAFRAEL